MPRLVTATEFDAFIREKRFAVIHFDAPWNGTGQPLRPRFQYANDRFGEWVNFGEVNTDEAQQIAAELKLMNVPTVAFYRDGSLVDAYIGATQDIVAQTESLIAGKCVEYIAAKENSFR